MVGTVPCKVEWNKHDVKRDEASTKCSGDFRRLRYLGVWGIYEVRFLVPVQMAAELGGGEHRSKRVASSGAGLCCMGQELEGEDNSLQL